MYKFFAFYILLIYMFPLTSIYQDVYMFEFFQVFIILISFFLGGYLFNQINNKKEIYNYIEYKSTSYKILLFLFIFYIFLKIDYIFEIIQHLLAGDYGNWALQNAIDRYDQVADKGIGDKLGMIFFITYSFLLAGYSSNNKIIFYMLFVILIFIESSDLARAGVLIALTAYFTEFLIRKNHYFQTQSILTYIKFFVIFVFVAGLIFFFSAYFRVAGKDDIFDILMMKLSIYTIAMYEALLIWMHNTDEYFTTYGYATFTSIYKIFGINVPQGFYTLVETSYGSTNIYSNLRGLLTDFGFIFTVCLFFVFGFSIKYYTYNKMNLYAYFFIRATLFFLLFILISPFMFFTVFAAVVFSWILGMEFTIKKGKIYVK